MQVGNQSCHFEDCIVSDAVPGATPCLGLQQPDARIPTGITLSFHLPHLFFLFLELLVLLDVLMLLLGITTSITANVFLLVSHHHVTVELLKVEFLQDLSSAVLKQFCLYVPCGFWSILPILDRDLFVHYPCYITDQLQTSFILYLLEFIQIKCITRSCYNGMFSWETLRLGIHVDVSLTHTAYLSIVQTKHSTL